MSDWVRKGNLAPWAQGRRWWCRVFGCSFTIWDGWKNVNPTDPSKKTNTLILLCKCGRVATAEERIS